MIIIFLYRTEEFEKREKISNSLNLLWPVVISLHHFISVAFLKHENFSSTIVDFFLVLMLWIQNFSWAESSTEKLKPKKKFLIVAATFLHAIFISEIY